MTHLFLANISHERIDFISLFDQPCKNTGCIYKKITFSALSNFRATLRDEEWHLRFDVALTKTTRISQKNATTALGHF